MKGQEPERICRFCGVCSRADRIFCLGCGRRLLPPPVGALTADDFESDADRSGLDALRRSEPLPHLVEKLVPSGRGRSESWLSKYGLRVRTESRLDALVRGSAEVLGIERLPTVYVAPIDELNAFTTGGDEHPLLVICAPVFRALDYVGIEGLIAHELAHVRSKHVLYHSLAETIASGVNLAASFSGAGLLSVPIRMMLLSWYRESEVSADRASIMLLGNYRRFESLMLRLAIGDATGRATMVQEGSVTELMQTHPSVEGRLRRAREFASSPEFSRGRSKVLVAAASGRVMTTCAHCGLTSPLAEAFCPGCGVSRR